MKLHSRIKSLLIYSFIACGVVSCKKEAHYAYPVKEFDPDQISEVVIDGTKTDLIFSDPWQTVMIDSLLIVQVKEPTCFLGVYNTKDMSRMMGLCTIGNARNEFNRTFYLLSQTYRKGGDAFITTIDKYRYVKEVNLTESMKTGHTVVSNSCEYPSFNFDDTFLFMDNDITNLFLYKNQVAFHEDDFHGEYSVTNFKTMEKKVINVFPKPMRSGAESMRYYSSGAIYKHPERNLFVQACGYMDYLLFFDIDADNGFAVHKKGSTTFDDVTPDGRTLRFARGCLATKDYFFALYCEYKNDENGDEVCETKLYIFDWEGNLRKNIKLNPNVIDLTYNEETKILYGLDTPDDPKNGYEQTLYTFDMSGVF